MNRRPPLLISFLLAIASLPPAVAAASQLSWYGDGADQGGTGYWDTASLDWSANGSTFQAWNNSNNDGATFDYGPGYVWVTTPITVGNLTFNDTGFDLFAYNSDALAITLAGSAPTVKVTADATASISLPLAGSGGMTLSGSGSGELVLASSNTYSGVTTVSAAFLQLAAANALPSGNLVIDGGVIELAAGNFTPPWDRAPARSSSPPTAEGSRRPARTTP